MKRPALLRPAWFALGVVALLGAASVATATPSGRKWFSLPVTYRVFNHASINGVGNFQATALPVVERGFARWMGGAGTSFTCTGWRVTRGSNFSSPTGISALNAGDNQNLVIWLDGANWTHDSFTLGVTRTSAFPGSGQIVDADMEMNNTRTWKVGGTGNAVDVESITAHESGHFLGLDHTPNSSAVMYADYLFGEIKTTLHPNDINDVCTVYPAGSSAGQQGSPCVNDTQCTSGLKCRGAVGFASSLICTKECSAASTTCPTGYTCQDSSPAGTTGKACLVPFGSPDLCDFCTDGRDCQSGLCLSDGLHNWCSIACDTEQQCGPGYSCLASNSGGKLCFPAAGKCGGQCSTANDCAIGYACVSGTCEATGNAGDRCELSSYCKSCLGCVGTPTLATCQPCCAGGGAGGLCTSCPAKACAGGESCQLLANKKDSLCLPSGAGACAPCSASNPCQNGLSCVGGRCHASCNPANPGSCGACYATGAGGGLCACPGEVAFKGQACGATTGGGFIACGGGTTCVAGTCRAACDPSVQNSCGTGETCEIINSTAVCVVSDMPGQRCSTCQAGTCANGLECFNGRCYELCNVSLPACTTCVDIGGGTGLCACDDQRANLGEACGPIAGEVYSCNPGLLCHNGTCRQGCEPQSSECGEGELCVQGSTGFICAVGGDAGSTGTPDGGPAGDGGDDDDSAGGDAGCGCTSGTGGGALMLGVAALLGALRRRRR